MTLTDSYGLVKRGETDKTGRYDIQGLVSGAYRFSLRDGEALGQSQDVVVRSGSNRFDYKVGAAGSGSKSSGVERAE